MVMYLTYMRHSTLVPWLQKGQLKTVSSLSILFFGGSFDFDFLFPIAQVTVSHEFWNEISTMKTKQIFNGRYDIYILSAPHINWFYIDEY